MMYQELLTVLRRQNAQPRADAHAAFPDLRFGAERCVHVIDSTRCRWRCEGERAGKLQNRWENTKYTTVSLESIFLPVVESVSSR
jgi:hypothetical protein